MHSNNKIHCLVIDDEPPAREILKQHIAGVEALELTGTCSNAVEAVSFLNFRAERKMVKVFFRDILFIEGLKDYIKIVTDTKTIVTKYVLSTLEEMLPANEFLRIHKSYIVAISKIDSYNSDTIHTAKHE